MSLRYLYGPVPRDFSKENLRAERDAGRCLTFGWYPGQDLMLADGGTWDGLLARLPEGWRPDFVALTPAYARVPGYLWSAPVPLVALAADWNFLWTYYRVRLRQCEVVLTDRAGVAALGREGITWTRPANLFGCPQEFLDYRYSESRRDIDVLFVGNLQAAVQRERLPWLGRLARLGTRWNVVIRTGVYGDAYRQLLGRARVVFNRSVHGEANQRTLEAAAAGTLLFQEAENLEIGGYFRAGEEYVPYTAEDLEERLTYYLDHEDERRRLADAARVRAAEYSFARLWEGHVRAIAEAWPILQERMAARSRDGARCLLARVAEALSVTTKPDDSLLPDLEVWQREEPGSASASHSLGLVTALAEPDPRRWDRARLAAVVRHFRDAWALDSHHLTAGLNLAEALALTGQAVEAAEKARAVLRAVEEIPVGEEQGLDEGHFPLGFDLFRVEWERAAWSHAGDRDAEIRAKRDLLRWRLHKLLADVTDSLDHYRAAAALRPDLPATQAAFGCALARAGSLAEAVTPLRAAVADNPFDVAAARALFQVLADTGDRQGQRQLADDRRLLAQAAPQAVRVEPWFAGLPTGAPDNASAGRESSAGSAGGGSPDPAPTPPLRLETLTLEDFHARFGDPDTGRALCGYTPPGDTHAVLTLLTALGARRIVEIGTALGHMTANLTEWSPDDATVFTLGTVADLPARHQPEQAYENPGRAEFGRCAGHFGKAHKILFATADSLGYDFGRLAPLDFAFIDGAHDFDHVLADTRAIYRALRPGGCLVWHDFGSPVPWVEVRQAIAAAALEETVYHIAGTQVAFLVKQSSAPLAPVLGGEGSLAVVWQGDQAPVHSLALVNRAFCKGLLDRGHELSLAPLPSAPQLGLPTIALPPALAGRLGAPLSRPAGVYVRHGWPPDLTPPAEGHWVLIQPWEFGSLPRSWVGPMTDLIDEVWVYTSYLRDCYLCSGVPADRVHVVPLGVDPAQFHPGVAPTALQTRKRFKFLFVGGTVHRKGIDVLLEAYTASFRKDDNVCLVVKDMGVGTFYRGQTAGERIAAVRARPDAPEIEYIERTLTEPEMAGLYTACDCLAHPYRGEGFGLPIAEAMACGLPVVITGYGAALDFCGPEHGYLVPARPVRLQERRVDDLETVDYPWLAEPDAADLARSLRQVYEHPEEARAKGAAGAAHIRDRFTWDHAVRIAEKRLKELRRHPIRRFHARGEPLAAAAGAQPPASLCMMVKNEEQNLPSCLESVRGLFADIVIVDTGSTDQTRELARQYGARVFDFPWVDSFAAARNEGLRHAQGKYVFWMDADDRLDVPNREKLRAVLAGLNGEKVAYVMKCVCLPDSETRTATAVDHVRLFPAHPQLRWDYRVHEQILPGLRQLGCEFRRADVAIHHVGYQDAALRRRKLDRDLRLLELEHGERPDDPFILFNLGNVHQELGRRAEALGFFERSLRGSKVTDSITHKLYASVAQCQRQLGQLNEALATCEGGRLHFPHDVEILFQEGLVYEALGDAAREEACWKRVLTSRDRPLFSSEDTGLRGYKARHNLAVLYTRQRRLREAEEQWQAAYAERPDYRPAALALAELFQGQGRWHELERLAGQVEAQPEGEAMAAYLRARGLVAGRQFAAALQVIDAALLRYPDDVSLWVARSHALLQEGRDLAGAEAALRRILELDPDNTQARHNLAVLQGQQRRAG
jgi:glycosyltransferase involved in cell wall biosynthesis/Flp pilus assembly protein TadD